MKFTNESLWNLLRSKYKSFENITAKATADTFTEKGWSEISRDNINVINSFFELSLKVLFQKLDIAKVNTRLEESGLVEKYGSEYGGFLQRISIESIAPVSPGFINLQNGDSVDPFIVRKPTAKERFFEVGNFQYQSMITIQDFQAKSIFLDPMGMSSFLAGIMAGLENGYRQQKELNCYKALHECINSTSAPLQDTQKLTLASWTDGAVTEAELLDFLTQLQDTAEEMDIALTQPGYNANGYDTAYNKDDFVVLVRAGILNQIKRMKALNVHYEGGDKMLEIPFKNVMSVSDFGGSKYYFGDTTDYPLFPHYASNGEVDGWSLSEGGPKEKELKDPAVRHVDEDSAVLAVIAQKGLIFEDFREPYTVQAIHNPRGLYNNYFASQPNATVKYDANYGCIIVQKPGAGAKSTKKSDK